MAQANYTPIQLYYSSTALAVPVAGNLTSGELALNIADGKLYFKNASNVVTLLASATSTFGDVVGPASATNNNLAAFDGVTGKLIKQAATVTVAQGGTGQTSYTDGQLLIGNTTGNTLAKATLTAGSGITITNGSGSITIAATGGGGGVTSVTGTSPVVSSGGTTPAISLAAGYGDTLNPYASKTANFVLIAPNGSAGVPTFRAFVSADLSETLTVAKGGTGLSTYTANGVLYASAAGTLANGTGLTFVSGNLGLGVASAFYKFDVQSVNNFVTPFIASFNNTSTSTSEANIIRILQGASGSATGYIGTGGSAYSDASFQNNFVVGTLTSNPLVFNTSGVERARIDILGNLIQRVNTTAATLTANSTLTFSLVDNSTLRISVRGSDGTTRTATVALT
jgi:hypothetical protein